MGLINQSGDGKKPLFRNWYKSQKKASIPDAEIFDSVEEIRLSSTEEWILIEGKECVAMLSAESKAGKELWETLESFEGKLKGLKLVPAKGKLGFDLEPDDNLVVDWIWDEGKLCQRDEKSGSAGFSQKLTLENMRVPEPLTNNESKAGRQSSKAGK